MPFGVTRDHLSGPAEAPTLQQCLRDHAHALNAIRLALALLVLYSHAHPLGGFGPEPAWLTRGHGTTFGGFAVGAFFALSGLLVTMSGLRRTPYEYIRSRLLRIVPAYAFVLLAVATLIAPLVWRADHGTFSGYFTVGHNGPALYVLRNLLFPTNLQHGIHDVFATTTPYGTLVDQSAVNGSLWTLPYEIRCYVAALILVIIGRWLGPTRVSLVALGCVGTVIAMGHIDPAVAATITPAPLSGPMAQLLFAFLCGALLGTLADRLRVDWRLVGSAAIIYVLSSALGGMWFRTFALGSLAILLPFLASRMPARRLTVFRHDLSYGAYLWAFPIQQTASYLGWHENKLAYLGVTSAATLALAALSWFAIERPLLRRRRSGRSEVHAPIRTPRPLDLAPANAHVRSDDLREGVA